MDETENRASKGWSWKQIGCAGLIGAAVVGLLVCGGGGTALYNWATGAEETVVDTTFSAPGHRKVVARTIGGVRSVQGTEEFYISGVQDTAEPYKVLDAHGTVVDLLACLPQIGLKTAWTELEDVERDGKDIDCGKDVYAMCNNVRDSDCRKAPPKAKAETTVKVVEPKAEEPAPAAPAPPADPPVRRDDSTDPPTITNKPAGTEA